MIPNKLMPWRMAQARRKWVTFVTLGLIWTEAFIRTWSSVKWPEGKK